MRSGQLIVPVPVIDRFIRRSTLGATYAQVSGCPVHPGEKVFLFSKFSFFFFQLVCINYYKKHTSNLFSFV
jgi:hypothetical protein